MGKRKIREQIRKVLPELKKALQTEGEEVTIGGVAITRKEAEKMCIEFEKKLNSKGEYILNWNIIPLNLSVVNKEWRALQESLNQLE